MARQRTTNDQLCVTSHVGRDLLQTGALFHRPATASWEYIVNELQYRDLGVRARVRVTVADGRIIVSGNGRGMGWSDLQRFFTLHGENEERRQGRPGRGLNGTGKSAGFGIAGRLGVRTVRNALRCTVELTRADVLAMTNGDPVPVRVLEKNVPTDEPNGTTITLSHLHVRDVSVAEIIRYVERNLATMPQAGEVWVNDHLCTWQEPDYRLERVHRPQPELARVLGDVPLTLRVTRAPLDKDQAGVAISANGVLHEQTLAGAEGKDMAQYIYGRLDVPRLDDEVNGPVPPFDQTRRLQLNPNNPLVATIYAFIGPPVEALRQELVAARRQERLAEEARRLSRHGEEIARLINTDFRSFRDRLTARQARAEGAFDRYAAAGKGPGRSLAPGDEVPARPVPRDPGKPGPHNPRPKPKPRPPLLEDDPNPDAPTNAKVVPGVARVGGSHGGFRVEFDRMGDNQMRARYIPDGRTIYLNLDHPQIAAALGNGGIDAAPFRRLAGEVAFTEYAIAVTHELNTEGEFLGGDTSEPLVVIRETLDRITRAAAGLYAN
jgi:hypothetical protein